MKLMKQPTTGLFPVPAVLVTVCDEHERPNVLTIAWTANVCSRPPMLSISLRPQTYSHGLLKKSGEFCVNIPGAELLREVDYCGTVSGRDGNKFAASNFDILPASNIKAPLIAQCPVNLECSVRHTLKLGSHEIFIGEVLAMHVDEDILDDSGKINIDKMKPLAFADWQYWELGRKLEPVWFSKKVK